MSVSLSLAPGQPELRNDQPLLQVNDISKTYPGGKTVLRNVSFTVYPKETFVVLGGSGCGKSTLLNILIGTSKPSRGEVFIFGKNIHQLGGPDLQALHRRCGVLFQFGALLESNSLLENVILPLSQHLREVDPEILKETARLKLGMVGMQAHSDKHPSEISGGMKKRVAMARALALDPELVFADEPTSGLDPVSTKEFDDLLIRLTRRIGAAAVVVTHDIASFNRIADRAVLLGGERDGAYQGQVIFQGTKSEFRQTAHPVVRRFLGSGEEPSQNTGAPSVEK
jgi:phospholipid/cholesterol/gamma-HCH transport system ATP-binding protein